jgi:hypothetical protein
MLNRGETKLWLQYFTMHRVSIASVTTANFVYGSHIIHPLSVI